MDFFFNDHLRLDWGLGNPNKTAALISCISLSCWIVAAILKPRKISFVIAGLGFLYFACISLDTYSRGGMVATIVGLIPIAIWVFRQRSKFERCYFLGLIIAIIGYGISNDAVTRASPQYVQVDGSVINRLPIYEQVPRMLAAHQHGIENGQTGVLYSHFYQDLNHKQLYQSLINYHATVLVENPWWWRILYVSSWAAAFTLFYPFAGRGSYSRSCREESFSAVGKLGMQDAQSSGGMHAQLVPLVGLSVALSFFASCCFSTIGETWQTWIPLAFMIALVLVWRIVGRHPINVSALKCSLITCNLALVLTCLLGLVTPSDSETQIISYDRDCILIKKETR